MKIIQATQITPYEVNTFWNYKQTEEPTALYINYFLTNLMFFFFALFCLRMNTLTAHCSFFTLTNFSLYNIYLWTLLNILFFWTLKHLNYDMQNMFKLDYLFSLMNIFFFFCLLMVCNNLYSFLLILEVCSYFFFYKLMMVNHFNYSVYNHYCNYKNYYSILFYHYWISTISTFLYFFFFLNIINRYGSVYFGFLAYTSRTLTNPLEIFFFEFFFIVFILCFCLKLGFSPFHLFKLQIYDGLGYAYILFYTTYYFIGFFFIISIIFFKLILPCLAFTASKLLWGVLICLITVSANLYINTSFKWFLVLSTLLNLLNLFLILILFLL